MIKSVLINRRTCLQGMGASLALPLLEAMGSAETWRARRTSHRSGWDSCICPMA